MQAARGSEQRYCAAARRNGLATTGHPQWLMKEREERERGHFRGLCNLSMERSSKESKLLAKKGRRKKVGFLFGVIYALPSSSFADAIINKRESRKNFSSSGNKKRKKSRCNFSSSSILCHRQLPPDTNYSEGSSLERRGEKTFPGAKLLRKRRISSSGAANRGKLRMTNELIWK